MALRGVDAFRLEHATIIKILDLRVISLVVVDGGSSICRLSVIFFYNLGEFADSISPLREKCVQREALQG